MIEGTTPSAQWVRDMFGRITPRYDLLNHLLSFNIDRLWRAHTVKRVQSVLMRPDARVLDLCCGTGDLMLALETKRRAQILGSDFCHPMLLAARQKVQQRNLQSRLFEADALSLPLRDQSLDLITVAFGFRNFASYRRGLEELFRVLRRGGMLAILEFSQPENALVAKGYQFYSRHVLPALGGLISGSREAYTYLPESVRKFPNAVELAAEIKNVGFSQVSYERLTGGVVALHVATVTK